MENVIRKHIIFHGYVQGVGFRYYAKHKAEQLRLTGWVKNLCDGSVEMEVQGMEEGIDMLILFLEQIPHIQIQSMDVKSLSVIDENGFYECD